MPNGAGDLNGKAGGSGAGEPTPLERLVAAGQAGKQAQRKKEWIPPSGTTRAVPSSPWFSVTGAPAGGLCGERDGYIHPDYPQGPPPSVQPSDAPEDPYSFATPSATAGCRPTTGT